MGFRDRFLFRDAFLGKCGTANCLDVSIRRVVQGELSDEYWPIEIESLLFGPFGISSWSVLSDIYGLSEGVFSATPTPLHNEKTLPQNSLYPDIYLYIQYNHLRPNRVYAVALRL